MTNAISSGWNLGGVLPETLRSLRTFGFSRTLAVMRSRLEDMAFDLRHGTDTVQTVPVEEAGVDSANRDYGQRYQPTGSSALGKILSGLSLSDTDVFVDFGCGKGRTLLLATDHSFRRVVGVEFSPPLCTVARENVRRYSARHPRSVQPEIVETDATRFALRGDETVFYFFHPFGPPVLQPVLDNIATSLREHPRRAWLVYYLPVHRDLMDRSAPFKLASERTINGYDCLAYRHDPAS